MGLEHVRNEGQLLFLLLLLLETRSEGLLSVVMQNRQNRSIDIFMLLPGKIVIKNSHSEKKRQVKVYWKRAIGD